MPPSKKLKSKQDACTTARNLFNALPRDVLRSIVLQAVDEQDPKSRQQKLLALCTLTKSTRATVLADVYASLAVDDVKSLSLLSRTLKGSSSPSAWVKQLSISIPDIYSPDSGSKKAATWKGHALKQVLGACTSLQRLTLTLGPPAASSPLTYILRDFPSTFAPLKQLTYLCLSTSEIWMHHLVPLLAVLPSLRLLNLDALLRGDCHTNKLDSKSSRPSLQLIKIKSNSLGSQHVAWLLEGQTALEELEMALPGGGAEASRSLHAVEKVADGIKSLKLWSSWPAPKTTKAESTPVVEQSPLLPALLRAAPTLVSLSVASIFAPPTTLHRIFSLPLDELKKLEIEDTAQSGMRAALGDALGGGGGGADESDSDSDVEMDVDEEQRGCMPRLEEVVSVGTKRGNTASSESGKRFAKVCKGRGIKWSVV